MASINYATREISCKIVYYGPGLSGKTTNLQIIHRKIPDKDKSEMVSLATETDRTLFFDFLPLDLGSIKGFSTKFQLYTVPGQVYYNATRKLVLRGVDGVVFVVDSQVDKLQENLESFANLQENLREYGHSIENIPLVLQFNKRDLPNIYPVDQLNALLNKHKLAHYEAVAATGVGVFTTLKGIGKAVIDKFNSKYAGFQGTRRPARPEAPAAPAVSRPAAPPAVPQPPAFGQAPRPATGPQPYPGSFGIPPQPAPRPQAPGPFGAPPSVGQGPGGFAAPGNNPFAGNTQGLPGQGGFSGPVSQGQPPASAGASGFGGLGAGNTGFGMGSPNPFAAPGQSPGNLPRSGFPGAPVGGPGPSGQPQTPQSHPAPFPSFPGAKPMAPTGGMSGSGGNPQGGIPQQMGTPNFTAPPNIPVSPFVDNAFGKAPPAPAPGGFRQAPNPFSGGLPASNPFSSPAPGPGPVAPHPLSGGRAPQFDPNMSPMGGFGAPLSPQPAPGQSPMGGGFPSAFPGSLGAQNPLQGGPGKPPGFNPGPGFGGSAPAAPSMPANPGLGQGGFGSPWTPAANPGFGAPAGANPFQPPVNPMPSQPPTPESNPPSRNIGGLVDNSGIVTTFEDLAKDDSFKTKKLPHPNDKKKGFFDGLFKKEK